MDRRTLLKSAASGVVTSAVPWAAAAQALPDQVLRWIVPYPAGGGTDVLARTVADAMRVAMGQQIVIDNRPGASTNIAAQIVASAKPDGTTVMSADNALLAFNEHLFRRLPFSPEKDFTYVGGMSRFSLALVVHPGFEAQTLKQFITYARAHPGKLNYASPGNGSPHHLAMEMFKLRTGTYITHIPYRGAAPAMQDVMAGQVPCMFLDLAAGLPVIQSGKVLALAIGSQTRVATLPAVPTLAEGGVPDTEVFAFQGILAPAGLPSATLGRLNAALNHALTSPAVQKRMADFSMEAMPGSPEQFKAFSRNEAQRWGKIIQSAGITLD